MATNTEALRKAIRVAGSQSALADKLRERTGWRISQKGVAAWLMRRRVPVEWLIHIEAITGVTCHELDPEHYPRRSAA